MNFSQEIINVLDYLCQKFGIAIDWTSDSVMPYLEDLCGRYIHYEIFTSIAWCVVCIVIVIAVGLIWGISSIVVSITCARSDIPEISKYLFFISLAISAIVLSVQAFDIIECYTIPEKTILEYLEHLMSSMSNR